MYLPASIPLVVFALLAFVHVGRALPSFARVGPRQETASTAASASLIFNYTDSTFIENLAVLRDGKLLFTTLDSGELRVIDPKASKPRPRTVAALANATGLTGIARLANPDQYAVTGGIHTPFAFVPGSMSVYVVSASTGRVTDIIPVPDTAMMNGLAALPNCRTTLLSADSITGNILRIDVAKRRVSVAFTDPALSSSNPAFPFGVNGLRIRGKYLYFTNSGEGTFGRVRIDDAGYKAGGVEILARLESAASFTNAYDDFDIDGNGNAYLALHSTSVTKVTPSGRQTTFAGGPGGDVCDPALLFREPTSVAVDDDGKSIYVATGGNAGLGCQQDLGGQLIKVRLR